MVRVALVGVVVEIRPSPSARVARLMSLIGGVVRVALVGVVVEIRPSPSARVA